MYIYDNKTIIFVLLLEVNYLNKYHKNSQNLVIKSIRAIFKCHILDCIQDNKTVIFVLLEGVNYLNKYHKNPQNLTIKFVQFLYVIYQTAYILFFDINDTLESNIINKKIFNKYIYMYIQNNKTVIFILLLEMNYLNKYKNPQNLVIKSIRTIFIRHILDTLESDIVSKKIFNDF